MVATGPQLVTQENAAAIPPWPSRARGEHPGRAQPPAEAPGPDERLRRQPLWRRIFVRPSVGARIAAIVVFVFFTLVDADRHLQLTGRHHVVDGGLGLLRDHGLRRLAC